MDLEVHHEPELGPRMAPHPALQYRPISVPVLRLAVSGCMSWGILRPQMSAVKSLSWLKAEQALYLKGCWVAERGAPFLDAA